MTNNISGNSILSFVKLLLVGLLTTVLSVSCNKSPSVNAESLIDQSIAAHGMGHVFSKVITFNFRERSYSLQKDSSQSVYRRITIQKNDTIVDELKSSSGFTRFLNGNVVQVPDSMAQKYSASVNSVLYFVQIPLVLKDPAVNAEYLGITTIKDKNYHSLKVTFSEEDGGEDFQDEYRYWIDEATREVDYLAYSYHTDEGGIRFREAFGKQRTAGILFQDYRNYKPENNAISLDSLPKLFERKELLLLSTIENRDILVHKISPEE